MSDCGWWQNLSYYSLEKFEPILLEKCTLLSVTVILLLWVIILQVRIFYGKTIVNKLTIKPLNWAMRALIAKLIFQILSLFVIAKEICWYVTANKTYIEMIYDRGSVLKACYYFFLFAYGFCYIAFTASIFVEQRILMVLHLLPSFYPL